MLAVRPMGLADHFSDAFGEPLLLPGTTIDAAEQLYEPYAARFDDLVPILGRTGHRQHQLMHLSGLMLWLDRACGSAVRVWLRGDLASTLRSEPTALDVLALQSGQAMSTGDEWIRRVLSVRPRLDDTTELVFDMIRADDDEEVSKERRRSAVRCRDATTDEPIVTGWWEVWL